MTSSDFLKSVSDTIEDYLKLQSNDEPYDNPRISDAGFNSSYRPRLFNFTHGHIELHRRIPKQSKRAPSDSHIVLIEFGGETTPYTDLISCLSGTLSKWTDTGSSHDVIIEPSDVFCFHVRRAVNQEGKFSPEPFSFPKYIYLDQFLLENLELANETRLGERKLLDGISELTRMKEGLTQHNVGGSLDDEGLA